MYDSGKNLYALSSGKTPYNYFTASAFDVILGKYFLLNKPTEVTLVCQYVKEMSSGPPGLLSRG